MDNQQMHVAVLGTGLMGEPMARNLARSGFSVTAWNRTAAKAQPLAGDGVRIASTPAGAVRDADVVLTMLTDADAALDAMRLAAPGLRDSAIWIQSSTVGERVDELIAFARERSIDFVDAPVQGTRQPAIEGKLLVICAAQPGLRDRLQPIFDAVGSKTLWVADTSELGSASRLKIATHTYVAGLTHAIGEALSMATALDVDPRLFLAAMADGPLDCAFMRGKAQVIIGDDYTASFSVLNSVKDAHIVLDAADRHDVVLDCTRAGLERYERLVDADRGDDDMAATYLASFMAAGQRSDRADAAAASR
jgi:3-hydroxyisobutyrate dehydrogenase